MSEKDTIVTELAQLQRDLNTLPAGPAKTAIQGTYNRLVVAVESAGATGGALRVGIELPRPA